MLLLLSTQHPPNTPTSHKHPNIPQNNTHNTTRNNSVVEHRPVEKEFVTETRFVGERPIPAAAGETSLGVTERIVEAAQPGPTCPVPGAPIVSGGGETVGRVEDPTAATGMTGVGTTSGAAGTGRFDEGGRML